ncbi:MAG: hypothetical protein R3A44_11370 [Caldilineaceae bacterium]
MSVKAISESQATRRRAGDNVLNLLIFVVIFQFSYPMTEGNDPVWLLAYQVLYLSLMVVGI